MVLVEGSRRVCKPSPARQQSEPFIAPKAIQCWQSAALRSWYPLTVSRQAVACPTSTDGVESLVHWHHASFRFIKTLLKKKKKREYALGP